MNERSLTRFAWLSIFAAVVTISLKAIAYFLTGSVGLLSDALESGVNLAAAIMALLMLKVSEKPPDKEHLYGHTKAEYFSSIVEGVLIIIAALSIIVTSVDRLLHPKLIEQAFAGLAVSIAASLINFGVAVTLLKAGKKNKSVILQDDGHHLLTDVWTSVGVIVGVGLVFLTNVQLLDPIIALLVATNIIVTGFTIMKQSALGLMDTSLPDEDLLKIREILSKYQKKGMSYHGLKSRQSATRSFMSVHILVPGNWTVQKGHNLLEEIELAIGKNFPKMTVFTHLEPIEDPKSREDISIDRQ